ncbi:MAG: D-tyrosyl-tRNA(Tyr) deacylase [Spirochaetes bacterium]|uniref:D-aminoacyl-tRNA deacylase n=1 Tax=Candidatus Ornithospirochaeta stercoripullorum TaxID=2840899 RepID=A0A9D9DZ17_9SPIO|nr:D-tyrosyl-tRNA(Tyr) deacylase [Candidatus Ornithospirochaeta stercoripullorum]
MKAVIQRVLNASCQVDGEVTGAIEKGLLVYFGVDKGDDASFLPRFLDKMLKLRIFEDENGKMNRSVEDIKGGVLFISQFTLSADVYHGNRPSFDSAEEPGKASALYDEALSYIAKKGIDVAHGIFGAHMEISYINDGPVTFILDSDRFSGKS